MTAPTDQSKLFPFNGDRSANCDPARGTRIDPNQMFDLIDGLLPFEACLYHRVLPLAVEGKKLHLGMVDTEDATALDYFRRLLAYLNYSVVPKSISSQTHQAMLSAYLNQASKQQPSHSGQARSSYKGTEKKQAVRHQADDPIESTLIVDSPEKLEPLEHPTTKQSSSVPVRDAQKPARKKAVTSSPKLPLPVESTANVLPELKVRARNLSSPVAALAKLPPQELLQELLARVLAGGIGRLYFERHKEYGRILWSLNGVLQSVLEELDPQVFQGVINELKLLTYLPLIPVQRSKQVELERRYKQTRLLLRLRVMPGTHGEEATLQVLRGAALKFYQQQQLASLGRDALTIAQQLQQKLNEIGDRARANPNSATDLEALPALNRMLSHLHKQVQDLTEFSTRNQSGS